MDPQIANPDTLGCLDCGIATFSTKSNRKAHFASKSHHTKSGLKTLPRKSFLCPVCGAGFYRSSHVSRHIDKVHPGQNLVTKFCCEVCGKTFGAPESLSRHVNSQCGKDSSLSYQLSTGIVSAPMTKFCVTIFVPAMAEDLKQVYDIDHTCSKLDRNYFAVVLLSCSFGVAMGTSGKIRIILSQCFLPSELECCCRTAVSHESLDDITELGVIFFFP